MNALRTTFYCAALALGLSMAGCDGSTPSGSDAGPTSCQNNFSCSGSACSCDTPGRMGTSCCRTEDCTDGASDSNNCESVCRVCM